MLHYTTKKHFEKYHNMALKSGCSIKNSIRKEFQKEFLEKKYKEDKNLNNIPLIFFDRLFYSNWRFKVKYDGTYHGPCSLADNTCMYKHLMIYEILECTPAFESEDE